MARVIAITGAGAGLGRALARRFASEGETVVLLGRTLAKVQAVAAEIGERSLAIGCDVSSPGDVRKSFAVIAERFGAIDVLINNAAIYDIFPIEAATDEQILSCVSCNLTGAILCARSAIPLMHPGSHIINVSSDGVELPFPLMTVYQATKAGLERFTTGLYRELDPAGIRVSYVRAAAMMEEGRRSNLAPEFAARFLAEATAAGLDLRKRPVSQYQSATQVFRTLIDLPDDLHALSVALMPRRC